MKRQSHLDNNHTFIATAAKGIEPLLADELRSLGADGVTESAGFVLFAGPLSTAYRACLWSRTASRVILDLGRREAATVNEVYDAARAMPWEELWADPATVAVDFTGTGSGINNTMYGAQLVKDALVDRVRERRGKRPAVDPMNPGLRVSCHLHGGGVTLGIDLSGEGLHRRGYREETVAAPLRETLAAALLIKAGWPEVAAGGGSFLDPMAGSGTLVIEAALMAADAAPGLLRERWGFAGWTGHDAQAWGALVSEAFSRREAGLVKAPRCAGLDADKSAVTAARRNAKRAMVNTIASFERRGLSESRSMPELAPGLILTNPPYGRRLGAEENLAPLYETLGDTLKKHFPGWRAAVLTAEPELGKRMGLRAHRVNAFFNGQIPCKLLQFKIGVESFVDRAALDERKERIGLERAMGRGAEAFVNRIKKNLRTVGRWAAREGIECYRLYDADLPEYAVAVDIYGGKVHVQEYAAPASIDATKAAARLKDVMTVLPHALERERADIVLKIRIRQKGKSQYPKFDDRGEFIEVREGDCRFLVNMTDHLDTGLFLDHRPTRAMLGRMARGKRFLNLFCYTGTATVHAALGGASATTSVDMSGTYLDWAQRNLDLNGIRGREHRLVRADCMEWIDACRDKFDLVFLDPPTFSNSKRMEGTFDVQRDHVALLSAAARLLDRGGVLVFSCNRQKFKLDEASLKGLAVEDISKKTIPPDFERSPRVHQCWIIRRNNDEHE